MDLSTLPQVGMYWDGLHNTHPLQPQSCLCPQDLSRHISSVGGGFPQYLPRLGGAWIQSHVICLMVPVFNLSSKLIAKGTFGTFGGAS